MIGSAFTERNQKSIPHPLLTFQVIGSLIVASVGPIGSASWAASGGSASDVIKSGAIAQVLVLGVKGSIIEFSKK